MRILSFNSGHDGAVVFVRDGKLAFSFESEKNGFPRYSPLTISNVLHAFSQLDEKPDVMAVGGWVKDNSWRPIEAGYFGVDRSDASVRRLKFFGEEIPLFSSTHERAHVFATYGLSPLPQGEPCYVLIWEGSIGCFYEVNQNVEVVRIGQALNAPGNRYAALYALAEKRFPPTKQTHVEPECAGKLMALAAFGKSSVPTADEQRLIDYLLHDESLDDGHWFDKAALQSSPWFNIGVEDQSFRDLARKHSDAVFDRFLRFAEQRLPERYPLLIGGGCGLNCEWNSRWTEAGLFDYVFVPPCPNDSGSAIGTAVEAMHHFSGRAKLDWRVDAGQPFMDDKPEMTGVSVRSLDLSELAKFLAEGAVIAWIQGRCEIGPRALGHRSILAAPFSENTLRRLNEIKQRESYRPIAPVCLEDEVSRHFAWSGPSPHMLYFQKVLAPELRAVTHIDNSARVQTVNSFQNPRLAALLESFRLLTGFGVLCNTSLNFKGSGFINRTSDLLEYCRERRLDGFVIEDQFYKTN